MKNNNKFRTQSRKYLAAGIIGNILLPPIGLYFLIQSAEAKKVADMYDKIQKEKELDEAEVHGFCDAIKKIYNLTDC